MKITTSKISEQVKGSFAGGAILENKPVGFPQEGGKIRAYSNLMYWAHAWSDKGGLIGEHPHQGFEIVSYVIKGTIEHYDSKLKGWKTLEAGDFQVIRSRDGITHAEKLNENSAIFQIWFDPNLKESMMKSAAYNDYKETDFPLEKTDSYTKQTIKGSGSPVEMDTENIALFKYDVFANSTLSLDANTNTIYSLFLMDGSLTFEDKQIEKGEFVIIEDATKIDVKANSESTIFLIETPAKVTYKRYVDGGY